jgi:hypothetical protein
MIKKSFLYLAILFLTASICGAVNAETLKKLTAVAKKPVLVLPNDIPQLDFVFDKPSDLKAWLRDNGNFLLEGYIRHNHFRCGTYQLGIQFGVGDGCANVDWLSEPIYISRERQCNQAVLHHDGSGNVPEAAARFGEVSCAQLFIKCDGVCGTADMPRAGDSSGTGVLR